MAHLSGFNNMWLHYKRMKCTVIILKSCLKFPVEHKIMHILEYAILI